MHHGTVERIGAIVTSILKPLVTEAELRNYSAWLTMYVTKMDPPPNTNEIIWSRRLRAMEGTEGYFNGVPSRRVSDDTSDD